MSGLRIAATSQPPEERKNCRAVPLASMSEAEPFARAVVADPPGEPIRLALYAEDGRAAVVALDPVRAVDLARELLDAAGRRLHRPAVTSTPANRNRRRGGDPKAEARAERNAGVIELAQLTGAALSLGEMARQIISKATRYYPAPGDETGSAERRALHRISKTGLEVPGSVRHLERILAGATSCDIQKNLIGCRTAAPTIGTTASTMPSLENTMRVDVDEDLAVAIGAESTRLSPGEAFQLAETLIRRATVRMITEEADRADASPLACRRTRTER